MGAKTKIAWADSTWPVINGCRRVTEGCRNCYAERLVGTRLKHNPWYEGLTKDTADGPRWTGKWRLNEPHLEDPLRWRDPRWIFVCDRGDLFFGSVPFDVIRRVADVMRRAHWHRFLVLTKRPFRMADFSQVHGLPPNVWAGVSIHDQRSAEDMLDILFLVKAANYFVSYEPAIGPADLTPWLHESACPILDGGEVCSCAHDGPHEPRLGLAIVGGESDQNGPARPFNIEIARDTIRQCRAAGVPVFNKQLGSCPITGDGEPIPLKHRAGADPAEWPEDLRVQEMPEVKNAS